MDKIKMSNHSMITVKKQLDEAKFSKEPSNFLTI